MTFSFPVHSVPSTIPRFNAVSPSLSALSTLLISRYSQQVLTSSWLVHVLDNKIPTLTDAQCGSSYIVSVLDSRWTVCCLSRSCVWTIIHLVTAAAVPLSKLLSLRAKRCSDPPRFGVRQTSVKDARTHTCTHTTHTHTHTHTKGEREKRNNSNKQTKNKQRRTNNSRSSFISTIELYNPL